MPQNNMCGGVRCTSSKGEVRVLPYPGGNLILCRSCFNHEIQYRKERNEELGTAAQFDLPKWEECEVYQPE